MIRLTAATLPLALMLCAGMIPARAEQPAPPPSTAPSPAETSPLPTTTDPNPPADGAAPMPAPVQGSATPSASPPSSALPTLVESGGAVNEVDTVTLPAKPAAIFGGRTRWEEAVPNLKAAFKRIEDELAKAGIAPAGRPVTVFVKTEEDGFQFDAMIPIAAAPAKPPEVEGLRFGSTPSGRALRFKHAGTYDEVDGTYETLNAYLDAKEIPVMDQFVEEYISDLDEGADKKLDVNIYALMK